LQIYKVSLDAINIRSNHDSSDPCTLGIGALVTGGLLAAAGAPIFGAIFGAGGVFSLMACEPDGEYRAFYEIGGKWYFMNEWVLHGDKIQDPGILNDGLGDTGEDPRDCNALYFGVPVRVLGDPCWPFERPDLSYDRQGGRAFTVFIPSGSQFRIHVSGWEADGSDRYFGRIIDPYAFDRKEIDIKQLNEWMNDNLYTIDNFIHGADDDFIGEINIEWHNIPVFSKVTGTTIGIINPLLFEENHEHINPPITIAPGGPYVILSEGKMHKSKVGASFLNSNPNGAYSIFFRMDPLAKPG
jgi:hypothetical protein